MPSVGVTMSIHKLTAGSGYDYLTRQVAAHDATGKGGAGLATYYTEKGETPGVWAGSGMAGIDGLEVGDEVTADHMQSLFGSGHHPLGNERIKHLDLRIGRPGQQMATAAEYQAATRLGVPYKTYANDVTAFQREVGTRFAAFNEAAGLPGDWPIPAQDRARIRTEVARDFFTAEHGRQPVDARELAAVIARHSRPQTTAVAGYDLTFSPVKSFSVMWALADPAVAAALERAHHQAVADTLRFIEDHALFTREGANGVRQVETRGLVATAFTHRDSRAGDPDLHTHLAIANKVQTVQTLRSDGSTSGGKWLAIDGQPLHKMVVAASEFYNARCEAHARDALGVAYAERPNPDARKRPVREIVGIDADLALVFSKRRASVELRRTTLVTAFQATHGRPPTPVETLQLAQQATLETREAKHEPRTLAEQRAAWMREASTLLGSPERVQAMVDSALDRHRSGPAGDLGVARADAQSRSRWFTRTSADIVARMEGTRATWQDNHVIAEAWRHVKAADIPTDQQQLVADMLVDDALSGRPGRSLSLARTAGEPTVGSGDGIGSGIVEPLELRRSDGTSVYTKAHTELYTSQRVLAAEQRLVDAAGLVGGRTVTAQTVDLALLEATANGVTLNPGQATLVREMATSGARLQLAIAPAGSGKTTAMRVLARAWNEEGGTVIGLGPSAAAAGELGAQLRTGTDAHEATPETAPGTPGNTAGGTPRTTVADTLAMLTFALDHGTPLPRWALGIDERTVVVIDEAGMADTISLDTAVRFVLGRGASVRLIGDDQQLAAIGAGGVLRDIRATHGALQLSELIRFTDPAEGAASLALREGRPEALGYYLDHQRVHVGDLATMADEVFTSWSADRGRGVDAIMLAPTRDMVADLNQRARAQRLEGANRSADPSQPSEVGPTARLSDGNEASAGDIIITRKNNRSLRISPTDWVKNGDRWTVLKVTTASTDPSRATPSQGGGLLVQHMKTGRLLRLPASYVAEHTDLGYACTVHTAQGVTADVMHGLANGAESRQQLYTMMTRGRYANHAYLGVVGDGHPHTVIRPELLHPRTPTDILEQILAKDASPKSATTLGREADDPAVLLGQAAAAYTDALYVAAEHTLTPQVVDRLDHDADQVVPGLSEEPAWPALRAHLLLLGAAGESPVELLTTAATGDTGDTGDPGSTSRGLSNARDKAAVLDWRLDPSGLRNTGPADHRGPLPWLHATPAAITADPTWGTYLAQRAQLVTTLADQVRQRAQASTLTPAGTPAARPAWATQGARLEAHLEAHLEATVIGNVEVWRAATGVDPTDRRPTGHRQQQKLAATWQRHLNQQVQQSTGDRTPAVREWKHVLADLGATLNADLDADGFTPVLAERLASISGAGIDTHRLLAVAAQAGPLPDDHPAAALWWRISRQVAPAVAARADAHDQVTTAAWTDQLVDLVGRERTTALQDSPWWPALVSVVDHGLQRGWQLHRLLCIEPASTPSDGLTNPAGSLSGGVPSDVDECQAMVWRASIATHDIPADDPNGDPDVIWDVVDDSAAHDFYETPGGFAPTDDAHDWATGAPEGWKPTEADEAGVPDHDEPEWDSNPRDITLSKPDPDSDLDHQVDRTLLLAGMVRDLRVIDHDALLTEADVRHQVQRAQTWEESPVSRERMLQINRLTQDVFERQLHVPGAWGRSYLADRLGVDLTGLPGLPGLTECFRPGQAAASWTSLVDQLRRQGVTDEEMLATGVATISSKGNLIDRFRDRLMFPILHTPDQTRTQNGDQAGSQAGNKAADREPKILGFVGRRHPDHDARVDDRSPKYLNTASTALFGKGDQLFGAIEPLLAAGATPVIVEGPLDAIAVTVATAGTHVGVTPLGTSLTDAQVTQLARAFQRAGRDPIVATDGDLAGQVAAERDFWLLTGVGLDPAHVQMAEGGDPAQLLADHGPAALAAALTQARPLGEALLTERLDHLPADRARLQAATILGAQPPHAWEPGLHQVADRLHITQAQARRDLAAAVTRWDADPRQAARQAGAGVTTVKTRLERLHRETEAGLTPTQRWAPLAAATDTRLTQQRDWPLLAGMMQEIADGGRDVTATVRHLVGDHPLDNEPARDLRLRLLSHLDDSGGTGETRKPASLGESREARRQQALAPTRHLAQGPQR